MNLLVVTQAVDLDDPVLGFFHRWIEEFAQRCESVLVICLKEGRHRLPQNVRVLSLGKEVKRSRFAYLWRFYHYIYAYRKQYDAVFVHMNPEYIVLGGLFWRQWGKKVGLWYVHRQVSARLRAAVLLAHVVFTATKESLRIESPKVRALGHGIDTASFACPERAARQKKRIVSVGRITPIKRCEVLIEASRALRARDAFDFEVAFMGEPVYESDRAYALSLERQVKDAGLEGVVRFAGSVPFPQMPRVYCEASAAVNMAPAGGTDKAVLEALSCGAPVFACNEAFRELFGAHAGLFLFKEGDAADLAGKLERYFKREEPDAVRELSTRVREQFDLSRLVSAIMQALS